MAETASSSVKATPIARVRCMLNERREHDAAILVSEATFRGGVVDRILDNNAHKQF